MQQSPAQEQGLSTNRHAVLQLKLTDLRISSEASELSGGLKVNCRDSPTTFQPYSKRLVEWMVMVILAFQLADLHVTAWNCARALWLEPGNTSCWRQTVKLVCLYEIRFPGYLATFLVKIAAHEVLQFLSSFPLPTTWVRQLMMLNRWRHQAIDISMLFQVC